MIRLDTRTSARSSSAVIAVAVLALGEGCAGQVYAGPANVEGPPPVAGPVEDDGDVVYVQGPPVVEIETYPSVVYGGLSVYYVDGLWYQRGPRGWAYFRREPAELDRQRQEHWGRDHDPRWGDQRGAEHRGQDVRAAPPAQRPGAAEGQSPERRGPPAPMAQPRREELPAATAPAAQMRRGEEAAAPRSAPKRTVPVKRAPVPARTPIEPERR